MRKDSNIGTLSKRTMNGKRWKLAFNYGQKKGEVLCPMDVLMEDIQMVAMRENYTRERVKIQANS